MSASVLCSDQSGWTAGATGSPTVDKKKITDTIPLQDLGIRLVIYNERYLVLRIKHEKLKMASKCY